MNTYLWILHSTCLLWGIVGWIHMLRETGGEFVTSQAIGIWFCAAGLFAIAGVMS